MRDDELQSRISRIETTWTVLRQAHGIEGAAEALETLLHRYRRAVYVYLLGVLRDPDAADEVFQEFALRVVRGAFRNAQPEKGRFRNLIKTTLANLISDHRRKQNRKPIELQEEEALPGREDSMTPEAESAFVQEWRDDVLRRTWDVLAEEEPLYYAVLQYRADHPEARSEEIAKSLSASLGRALTAAGVRQTLHRARDRFAQLLLTEVSASLESPDEDRLRDELEVLGLLTYCQDALQQRHV